MLVKGNSLSENLYDLVVRLRALELRTGAHLLVTHCSGNCMIHQGTDGLSRGRLQEGVCLSKARLAYCPWGKSGCQRSPTLLDWFKDWLGDSLELLYPRDWYHYEATIWMAIIKMMLGFGTPRSSLEFFFGISLRWQQGQRWKS